MRIEVSPSGSVIGLLPIIMGQANDTESAKGRTKAITSLYAGIRKRMCTVGIVGHCQVSRLCVAKIRHEEEQTDPEACDAQGAAQV